MLLLVERVLSQGRLAEEYAGCDVEMGSSRTETAQ